MAINRLNPDYPDAGLVQLMPSSAAVGSGSATITGNGSVTFSGASSVSLNGIFSADYTTYHINFLLESASTQAGVTVRFRTSGTDNTSNVYYGAGQLNYAYNGSYFTDSANPSTQSQTLVGAEQISSLYGSLMVMEISNPFQSQLTVVKSQSNSSYANRHSNLTHNSTTSFDGMSFIYSSGNMTGKIQVYGYRN